MKMRFGWTMFALLAVTVGPLAEAAELYEEGFESGYADGSALQLYTPMWFARAGSQGPTVMFGQGVAGSVGLSAAQKHFQWSGRGFSWSDADLGAVIIGMDYQASAADAVSAPFDDDRMGWSITGEQEVSDADFFCVQLEGGAIRGFFRTSPTSGTTRAPILATLSGIEPLAWYRFRAKFTKLTDTSARIEVSLQRLDENGVPGDIVASATVADTSVIEGEWKWVPSAHYFTTPVLYPTFKNYNEKAPGHVDNGYLEIIRVLPDCGSTLTPVGDQLAVAEIGQPASPSSVDLTLTNVGAAAINYTVQELDADQQPADLPWLSLSTTGGSLASLGEEVITASLDTTGLAGGRYTAYVRVTDDCPTPAAHLRGIDLDVYACHWEVNSCNQERAYMLDYPEALPEDVVYRITNTGGSSVNYSVNKSGDAGSCFEWLVLANANGTLAPGEHADVVASVDPAALVGHDTDTAYYCRLTFTDGCSPQIVTRDVKLRYLGAGDTQVFAYGGDTLPTNDDSAGPGLRFDLDTDSQFNGAVEVDPEAANGSVWRLIDSTGTMNTFYRAMFLDPDSGWDRVRERGEVGSTLLARVKLRSWGPDGGTRRAMLRIAETNVSSADYHWGGTDGMVMEVKRNVLVQTGLGTDNFVTLRLTSVGSEGNDLDTSWDCGRIVRLYLNEDPTPVIEIFNADNKGTGTSGDRGLWFGDSSDGGLIDIAFDWVSGTNAGAFAPGEEVGVIGKSLIPDYGPPPPTCPLPFADTDEDGDVDQVDFAFFQRCASLPGVPHGTEPLCKCLDTDRDSDIDVDDFTAFTNCGTGPNVPFDPENPPVNCIP